MEGYKCKDARVVIHPWKFLDNKLTSVFFQRRTCERVENKRWYIECSINRASFTVEYSTNDSRGWWSMALESNNPNKNKMYRSNNNKNNEKIFFYKVMSMFWYPQPHLIWWNPSRQRFDQNKNATPTIKQTIDLCWINVYPQLCANKYKKKMLFWYDHVEEEEKNHTSDFYAVYRQLMIRIEANRFAVEKKNNQTHIQFPYRGVNNIIKNCLTQNPWLWNMLTFQCG